MGGHATPGAGMPKKRANKFKQNTEKIKMKLFIGQASMRWWVTTLLLSVFIHQTHQKHVLDLTYCDGDWYTDPAPSTTNKTTSIHHDNKTQLYNHYDMWASRTPFIPNNVGPSVANFVKTSCPAQQSGYTCYYLNNGDVEGVRPKMLERRYFVPHNMETCPPFTPIKFLELIANRKVLLLGDSTTGQIYESLSCAILKLDNLTTHTFTKFQQHPNNFKNPLLVTVPINPAKIGEENPLHAHIASGYLTIKEYNATIILQCNPSHNNIHLPNFISQMISKYHIEKEDIVIFNFGLTFNDAQHKDYVENAMPEKKREIEAILGIKRQYVQANVGNTTTMIENLSITNHNAPMIFLSDTTPQHYKTKNGYHTDDHAITIAGCALHPMEVDESGGVIRGDWRNEILHSVVKPLAKHGYVTMIPFAKHLHSQYDAHAGGHDDCTHWCFPSGINKYTHLYFYNAIRKRLLHEYDDNAVHRNPKIGRFDHFWSKDRDDLTWRLFPGLRNDEFVCIVHTNKHHHGYTCYKIEKGKLRQYVNLATLDYYEHIQIVDGATISSQKIPPDRIMHFIEQPLDLGDYVVGKPITPPPNVTLPHPTIVTPQPPKVVTKHELPKVVTKHELPKQLVLRPRLPTLRPTSPPPPPSYQAQHSTVIKQGSSQQTTLYSGQLHQQQNHHTFQTTPQITKKDKTSSSYYIRPSVGNVNGN